MDLSQGGAPVATDNLLLRFRLHLSQLLKHDAKADLLKDIDSYLPADPVFTIVATQDLQLSKVASGMHHYYPVSYLS